MNHRKRPGHFVLKILMFFLCFAASGFPITIKLGSLAPSGSPWDNGLRKIAAEWSRVSGGTVQMRIYAGGITGDEVDMISKMRIGQLQAAGVTGIGLCRIFPGVLAMQLPLTIRTKEELAYVLESMKPWYQKKLEEKGFTVLSWSTVGWAHFFSKEPVVMPDDLKKQKLFLWAGDPDGVQAWKATGFHVVPLSATDILTSLQSGMIDAYTTTPLSTLSYQWFSYTKNMCGMNWAPLLGGIIVSTSAWNSISSDLRPQLAQIVASMSVTMQTEIDAADSQSIEVMKSRGLVVSTVPLAAEAAWQTIVKESVAGLIDKSFDRKSYEMIQKHLADFRARK